MGYHGVVYCCTAIYFNCGDFMSKCYFTELLLIGVSELADGIKKYPVVIQVEVAEVVGEFAEVVTHTHFEVFANVSIDCG